MDWGLLFDGGDSDLGDAEMIAEEMGLADLLKAFQRDFQFLAGCDDSDTVHGDRVCVSGDKFKVECTEEVVVSKDTTAWHVDPAVPKPDLVIFDVTNLPSDVVDMRAAVAAQAAIDFAVFLPQVGTECDRVRDYWTSATTLAALRDDWDVTLHEVAGAGVSFHPWEPGAEGQVLIMCVSPGADFLNVWRSVAVTVDDAEPVPPDLTWLVFGEHYATKAKVLAVKRGVYSVPVVRKLGEVGVRSSLLSLLMRWTLKLMLVYERPPVYCVPLRGRASLTIHSRDMYLPVCKRHFDVHNPSAGMDEFIDSVQSRLRSGAEAKPLHQQMLDAYIPSVKVCRHVADNYYDLGVRYLMPKPDVAFFSSANLPDTLGGLLEAVDRSGAKDWAVFLPRREDAAGLRERWDELLASVPRVDRSLVRKKMVFAVEGGGARYSVCDDWYQGEVLVYVKVSTVRAVDRECRAVEDALLRGPAMSKSKMKKSGMRGKPLAVWLVEGHPHREVDRVLAVEESPKIVSDVRAVATGVDVMLSLFKSLCGLGNDVPCLAMPLVTGKCVSLYKRAHYQVSTCFECSDLGI